MFYIYSLCNVWLSKNHIIMDPNMKYIWYENFTVLLVSSSVCLKRQPRSHCLIRSPPRIQHWCSRPRAASPVGSRRVPLPLIVAIRLLPLSAANEPSHLLATLPVTPPRCLRPCRQRTMVDYVLLPGLATRCRRMRTSHGRSHVLPPGLATTAGERELPTAATGSCIIY